MPRTKISYSFGESGPILAYVERYRQQASADATDDARKVLGQFLTPAPVASFMASLTTNSPKHVRLLDAGAGIGSLTAAFVDHLLALPQPPASISVTAWEVDSGVLPVLHKTIKRCLDECHKRGITFTGIVIPEDFIASGVEILLNRKLGKPGYRFNCAILNPPYRKIHSASLERLALRRAGIESSNLYAGFVALAVRLLEPHGRLTAITPRSFCNGPYFQAFRNLFLQDMRFQHLHTFERRDKAFADDGVLQENIIFHAVKSIRSAKPVCITYSHGSQGDVASACKVNHEAVVSLSDPERVVHIPHNVGDHDVRERVQANDHALVDLGISVSTGRVVDFRAKDYLLDQPVRNSVPLIHPTHFHQGFVSWPKKESRKPNAIVAEDFTRPMFVPSGYYVLVKRFTSKEEKRRVVAVVFDPARIPAAEVAFENHINFFHMNGHGLPRELALGLAAYLNTSSVDQYFRQFSGHTQVNASDLRMLSYPSRETLEKIGAKVDLAVSNQAELDAHVEEELSQWQAAQLADPTQPRPKSKRLSLF